MRYPNNTRKYRMKIYVAAEEARSIRFEDVENFNPKPPNMI